MARESLKSADDGLPDLCLKAYGGSPWSALLVAIHIKAKDIAELARVVGIGPATPSQEGFDAVADAWRIYEDALAHDAEF